MSFALGFILGFLLAYIAPLLPRKKEAKPLSEEDERRQHKAVREYRNFMTYDGFDRQE
jgi:hypothetical protein